MIYDKIDNILKHWTEEQGLCLYTRYKDTDVRSVDVVGYRGNKVQIWIDAPQNDSVAIHLWDYNNRREDHSVPIESLESSLTELYLKAREWANQKNL
jgi:hypothetical protein